MDNLGTRLIASLLESKDLSALSEYKITKLDLIGDTVSAYEWTVDFVKTNGEWPTRKIVEENCSITLPDDIDPIGYICDLIRKRSLGKTLEGDLRRAADFLESRNPDKALQLISDASIKHRKKSITKSKVVSFRDSGPERIKTYNLLKTKSGYEGVETPWTLLDTAVQGWVNGTLNVITAMQNTGKTWFLAICANHAMSLGKRVGFITLEMTTSRIAKRLDSIKYKIPFRNLRDGDLGDATEKAWKRRVERDTKGDGDILLADKQIVRTVDDATAFVLEYRPDILFIDGGYRFQVPGSRGSWEQQLEIVRALQVSSEATNIPWIVSTQQGDASETGREKKRGKNMRAWNVRYGKEWIIDPDTVIGLYSNEDLRIIKELEIHILKMRDNAGDFDSTFNIKWDTTAMDFVESKGEDSDAEAAAIF